MGLWGNLVAFQVWDLTTPVQIRAAPYNKQTTNKMKYTTELSLGSYEKGIEILAEAGAFSNHGDITPLNPSLNHPTGCTTDADNLIPIGFLKKDGQIRIHPSNNPVLKEFQTKIMDLCKR